MNNTILKFAMLVPCTKIFGMTGATFSNFFYYFAIIALDVYFLNIRFKINWKYTLRRLLVMLIGILGSSIIYCILNLIFCINDFRFSIRFFLICCYFIIVIIISS